MEVEEDACLSGAPGVSLAPRAALFFSRILLHPPHAPRRAPHRRHRRPPSSRPTPTWHGGGWPTAVRAGARAAAMEVEAERIDDFEVDFAELDDIIRRLDDVTLVDWPRPEFPEILSEKRVCWPFHVSGNFRGNLLAGRTHGRPKRISARRGRGRGPAENPVDPF